MEEVLVYDRKTKVVQKERIYGHAALAFLYPKSRKGLSFIGRALCKIYARFPLFSVLYGTLQKTAKSKKKIKPFIKNFDVDSEEFEKPVQDFTSFNDFFIRKLKPSARPIAREQSSLVAPADGRYLFVENIFEKQTFYVKGQRFNVREFLGDDKLAEVFQAGSMLIARLCPSDYHRFHMPFTGTFSQVRRMPGPLFSVSPIALKKKLGYLWMNKRWIGEVRLTQGHSMVYAPVGATNVGSMTLTCGMQKEIQKGEEVGYFSFGGSAVLLFFQKDIIRFHEELLAMSSQGVETQLKMGESIGTFI
jgi:phosphatidylserine decarboxylase